MNANNNNKKLSTGIAGLDALFYGGIHTHKGEDGQKGILMLARGQHGVNKIHLAMQICEGLYNSSMEEIDKWDDVIIECLYAVLYKKEKDEKKLGELVSKKISSKIASFKGGREKEKAIWAERNSFIEKSYDAWFKTYGSRIMRDALEKVLLEGKEAVCKSNTSLKRYIINYVKARLEEISTIDITNILNNKSIGGKYGITIDLINRVYEDEGHLPKVLFISLNKDDNLLKSSYYDFYIQRLIRKIRDGKYEEEVRLSLYLLRSLLWERGVCPKHNWGECEDILEVYELPSITGVAPDKTKSKNDLFRKHIETGFIYYNGRTHGLHIRHQKGAEDTGDMLLCKLDIPDDYRVRIVGKNTLNDGNNTADGLTSFQNMMRLLDKYKKDGFDYIMIDGLSRLTKEEIAQCPFNALSDKLRSMCTVGIVTADEKLLQSDINVDIVLDMAIQESERPDHLYTAIKISKCLYQKNTYGWHRYKMRNAGIEVIPSIHYQMVQRFLMDDVVTDAVLPINEFPYPYWLNENETEYKDESINDAINAYDGKNDDKLIRSDGSSEITNSKIVKSQGILHGIILDKLEDLFNYLTLKVNKDQHVFFVCFDKNRSEFYDEYEKAQKKNKVDGNNIDPKRVHLFNFQSGYSHADEFLWALDQQVQAIEKRARNGVDSVLRTHYTHVIMVIGDLNYIHYAYPCLSAERLLLPAIATYTKRHHMTNYVYATQNKEQGVENTELHKKEVETIMQINRVANSFEKIESDRTDMK